MQGKAGDEEEEKDGGMEDESPVTKERVGQTVQDHKRRQAWERRLDWVTLGTVVRVH